MPYIPIPVVNPGDDVSRYPKPAASVVPDTAGLGRYESATYITAGDMSAVGGVAGGEITLGPEGSLLAVISWTNTGAPIGTLSLQFLDGSTWREVPGSSVEFTSNGNVQPNNNTATIVCYWRRIRVYDRVRLFYTRSSGGTANTSLTARVRSS